MLKFPGSIKKFPYKLLLAISIVVGACSSSSSEETRLLEASISSVDSISLFDSIVFDASGSEGDIVKYQWRLLSVPEVVTLESRELYRTEISSNTEAIINFLPRHPGTYTIELKVEDPEEYQKSTTFNFEVLPICENNLTYTNLLTETFDTAEGWTLVNPPENFDNNSCSAGFTRVPGYIDIGNGYLDIFSGTAIEFHTPRAVYMPLDDKIEFDPSKNYRIRISISGRMSKPYYWDLGITLQNTNLDLQILGRKIQVKVTFDTSKFGEDSSGFYFTEDLDIYYSPNESEGILFVCNQGDDDTCFFEMIETECCSSSIGFLAYNDNGETSCWYSSQLEIDQFRIDEFE